MENSIGETLLIRREKAICKMCGSTLEIRLIIYNQYGGQGLDLYCPNCQRIEYGVDPKIYSMAKTFVDKFEFNYYTEMYEDTRNYQLNIAKICEISMWLLNYLNSTDQYGFLKDGSIINVDVIK